MRLRSLASPILDNGSRASFLHLRSRWGWRPRSYNHSHQMYRGHFTPRKSVSTLKIPNASLLISFLNNC